MTDIEQKALALMNEVRKERYYSILSGDSIDRIHHEHEALCRAIEQHEAFRQEVSDAVQSWVDGGIDRSAYLWFRKNLEQFIIPAPKPDPLVDVLLEMDLSSDIEEGQHDAKWLRIKLDKLGFEIKEKSK